MLNELFWVGLFSSTIAIVSLLYNARQQKKLNSFNKINLLNDTLWRIHDDEELSAIYYLIEYQSFKYEEFHGTDTEKQLDKLLYTFESIARLYLLNHFKIEDIAILNYEYLVVYQNKEVKEYLSFVDKWFDIRGIKNKPFEDFKKVGAILEKNFFKI